MQNKMHTKRIRNLIVISVMVAIVLATSTYAWFIGMRTVNVASFDVEIKSTESLMLSLDGKKWTSQVNISKAILSSVSYAGNTNNWPSLIPMSTIGEMDNTASRMKLFEKASFTATKGGYRLLASRVDNTGATEGDGYVVFDLFVRNFSGNQYIAGLDPLDEEAIYLTTDSAATVSLDGGTGGTGIENSVRVAFAQIGRVIGTTMDEDIITGITCANDAVNGVTGICRKAQIWEPNDKKHVAAAISWYNTSCLKRKTDATGLDITEDTAYTADKCTAVADTIAYPTYAIKDVITSADNVDVYDGASYNGYTATTKLEAYDYFTDTMKLLAGTARPQFMSLSPNSVTKIRVYIYIEGQDIDNYDFSQIGKKISINFGFTKERFTPGDIEYEGPTLDTLAPIVTLTGNSTITLNVNDAYTESGATALDNVDGDVTANIVTDSSKVNTAQAGTYVVTYTVTDAAGNTAEAIRTVIVK